MSVLHQLIEEILRRRLTANVVAELANNHHLYYSWSETEGDFCWIIIERVSIPHPCKGHVRPHYYKPVGRLTEEQMDELRAWGLIREVHADTIKKPTRVFEFTPRGTR
jgi:hypothetical protein